MNIDLSDFIRYLAISSILIYFFFSYFESKRIKDEREDFIQLKTHDLVQKLTIVSLTICACLIALWPELPAAYPVLVLILTNLYGEIAAKTYFRTKI